MALSSEIDSLIQDIQFLETVEGFPGIEAFVEFEDLLGFQNFQSLTEPTPSPTPTPTPTPTPAGPPEPPPNLPKNEGQPVPNFEIPGDIIPKEFNITLNPIAWVLCDNGIGQIIDFVKGVVKGFLGGIKYLLDGVVGLVKSLVNLVKKGFNEVVKALKYSVRMLKEFYCASQHIRFSISKAAPVTRPEAGLEPIKPEEPRPPKPQVYPPKADGTPAAPDPGYQEIFNALIQLKALFADKVTVTIKQLQENELARYEDLRAQLISLIPQEYREEFADAGKTEIQKQIEKAKAEKERYIEGLENSIAAIEKQLSNLLKPPVTPPVTGTPGNGSGNSGGTGNSGGSTSVDGGTGTGPGGSDGVVVTPSTGVGAGSTGSDGVTVTPSTGVGARLWFEEESYFPVINTPPIRQGVIADLPPMEPFDESVGEVVADPLGATKQNVLDQINYLVQSAIRISNNILIVGSNNRTTYRSQRSIIETVRETNQKQRLKEQRDREDAERKRLEEERKTRQGQTLIYR